MKKTLKYLEQKYSTFTYVLIINHIHILCDTIDISYLPRTLDNMEYSHITYAKTPYYLTYHLQTLTI